LASRRARRIPTSCARRWARATASVMTTMTPANEWLGAAEDWSQPSARAISRHRARRRDQTLSYAVRYGVHGAPPPQRRHRYRRGLRWGPTGRVRPNDRARANAHQRAADPPHGRALQRARRADTDAHGERAAPALVGDPLVGRVRDARPRGGDRARRPRRRAHRRAREREGHLPGEPSAAAQRRGDPVPTPVRAHLRGDLERPSRRGPAEL